MKRTYSPEVKAKMVLEVLRGERTINEIASENGVHPTQLSKWKNDAVGALPSLFENDRKKERLQRKEHETEVSHFYEQIGKLTAQLDWVKNHRPPKSCVEYRHHLFRSRNPGCISSLFWIGIRALW